MATKPRDYDSTVARIAGNIIGHLLTREENPTLLQTWGYEPDARTITAAVAAARAIVDETRRTEPGQET